jgi:hypothetical protein
VANQAQIEESSRYYLGALMQLTGIARILASGGWAWIGILQLPVLTVIDSLLPEDERPRQISDQKLIDLPLVISGLLGLCVYAALAWKIGAGGSTAFAIAGMIASVGWLSVVPMLPVTHELYHRRNTFRRLTRTPILPGAASPPICKSSTRIARGFFCICSAITFISRLPPLWNRLNLWPRLEKWDRQVATPAEQELARGAGWPDWLVDDAKHAGRPGHCSIKDYRQAPAAGCLPGQPL